MRPSRRSVPAGGGSDLQSPASEPSTDMPSVYAEVIAGAVATAIRERFPSASPSPSIPLPFPSNSQSSHSVPAERSTFDLACDLRKRPKFNPPSLFENMRSRRSRKKGGRQQSKFISYVRDIVLLPMDAKGQDGIISIPRSSKRVMLGKAGLVGKLEITSIMSDYDVRKEICEVFGTPMGLVDSNIKNNQLFPFTYLQRAGSGCRSLCVPSVKADFEWTGR